MYIHVMSQEFYLKHIVETRKPIIAIGAGILISTYQISRQVTLKQSFMYVCISLFVPRIHVRIYVLVPQNWYIK